MRPELQLDLEFAFGEHEPGLSPEAAARQSQRKFVRNLDQLSVFDPERNPTGHVMTALEAYETFGLRIVTEAVEYSSAIILLRVGAVESALKGRREELRLPIQSVARAAKLPPDDVKLAESDANSLRIQALERIAFALGLDERLLAYHPTAGADARLAGRLRTLQADRAIGNSKLPREAVLVLAEAASIVRVQARLQAKLGIIPRHGEFPTCSDYGHAGNPAWSVGYRLAALTRERFELGVDPIRSMRGLVEDVLGVPVIQARLPEEIAGATVAVMSEDNVEYRGIVLNTAGQNQNVWVRRATLAHEIGHLLYDPDANLQRIRVDTYDMNSINPQSGATDYVEQRANAFAIAFLAPLYAVRKMTPYPISGNSISDVMTHFGLSLTSAQFHIRNAYDRRRDLPPVHEVPRTTPGHDWRANEDFTADYFPLKDTPVQRRGQFAGVVAAGYECGLISDQTAASYLGCSAREFKDNFKAIRSIYPIALPALTG